MRLDYRQGPKRIFWQYRDANGRTAKGLPSGCKAVDFLYFSGNKDTTHAVITEGEKATEAVAGALPSVRALGTVCGAATRPTSRALRRALGGLDTVTLWPDHDSDGLKHMDRIGTALASMGFEVKLVQVTDLPDKSDAADLWGDAIRTRIAEAVPWTPLIAGKREPDTLVPDVLPSSEISHMSSGHSGCLATIHITIRHDTRLREQPAQAIFRARRQGTYSCRPPRHRA